MRVAKDWPHPSTATSATLRSLEPFSRGQKSVRPVYRNRLSLGSFSDETSIRAKTPALAPDRMLPIRGQKQSCKIIRCSSEQFCRLRNSHRSKFGVTFANRKIIHDYQQLRTPNSRRGI
jgi:hypothetical protein